MDSLLSTHNGKLTINLHPGQTQAWDSIKKLIFIISGFQSGKTSFLPLWLDREIKEKGDGDYIAATATYDLFKLKFLPELRHYFCNLFGWQFSASERVIYQEYKPRMFTRIICRSAEAEGGLESASAKGALFDECGQDGVRVNAYEAILRRLALHQGRLLGSTTPYNLGWLKTEVYDRWRDGDPDIQVVQFKSIMNPMFPKAEYERARRTLPPWKFEMFYNGNFSRPAGLIYEDFTEAHLIDPFDVPLEWQRFLGVDFGAVNTAKVWIAKDPKSELLYLYREDLSGGKSTREHVLNVLVKNERNLIGWGGAKSETQQRMDWAQAGFALNEPPVSDVESGINRVISMLREHRLYVFKSCKGIIDEFGTYARELDANGQPTEKIKDKQTFHFLDALRYDVNGLTSFSKLPSSQPVQKSKYITNDDIIPEDDDENEKESGTERSRWKRY